MKTKLLFTLCLIASLYNYGQNVNIPDANFKTLLLTSPNINTNGDAEIQLTEASAYTGTIFANSSNIASLVGIEAFTNLTGLSCAGNQLTVLDISNNVSLTTIFAPNNQLTSLDTSNNTVLQQLNIHSNQLTSLDLSTNNALTRLIINNNFLTDLDVSNLNNLFNLTCTNNQISSLDLSANTTLTIIRVANNALTSLNVVNGNNANVGNSFFNTTNNPNLTCIQVDDVAYSSTNWTNIDAQTSFSTNCTACIVNIPNVNFKNYLVNSTLINTNGDLEIQCSEASAFTGFISANQLNISDLTGIEAFTSVTGIICASNQLTSLDLSQNTALEYLYCPYNQLTNLDLNQNTALTDLDCSNNQLTSLDISQTLLFQLRCSNNQLTYLNIANGNNSNFFDITVSSLPAMDARQNASLTCIQIDTGFTPGIDWQKDATASYSDNCSNLSVDEFTINTVSLYPNPTTSILNIEMQQGQFKQAKIYSILGTKVLRSSSKTIDTSNLKSGIYLIKIEDETGRITTKRFIKV